jgi:hypothetical protein
MISCSAQKSTQFKVEIADEFVAETIRKYVNENNVDVKAKVITIKAEIGIKKIFTITDEIGALYSANFTPTYYGVLDKKIVFFVFTRVEKTFKPDRVRIINEIDQVLGDHEVKLVTKMTNYSAPLWRLVEQCDGTYRLNKEVTPFEFDDIPCGYSIIRDSVKLDSLKLIKR